MERRWRHMALRPLIPTKSRKTRKAGQPGALRPVRPSLNRLPVHARTPEEIDPFGGSETHECAKARQRSHSGPGAAAWLRARPVDASRVIPAQEFLYAGCRHLGIEEHIAVTCSACGAADANTQYTRLCHRASAQVNQQQPFVHATSRFLTRCPSAIKWKATHSDRYV